MTTDSNNQGARAPRLAFLDGIRAIAALFVVIHHSYLTVYPRDFHQYPTEPLRRFTTSWMMWGQFGVVAFMVVSGYSLMIAVQRNGGDLKGNYWQFVRRRARRIIPPYWAAIALSTVLILTVIGTKDGTHWDSTLPLSWFGVWIHSLLLQDIFAARTPNHAFWSIALEWHVYFAFPAVLLLRKHLGVVKAMSLTTVVTVGGATFLQVGQHGFNQATFFALFLLGMIASDLTMAPTERLWPTRVPWNTIALGFFIATVVAIFVLGERRSINNVRMLDLVMGGASASLLVSVALRPATRFRRILEWRPLVSIGIFSYSLYLTHAPILEIVWRYFVRHLGVSDGWSLLFLLIAGIAASLVCAYCFFLAFEKPFIGSSAQRNDRTRLVNAPEPLTTEDLSD